MGPWLKIWIEKLVGRGEDAHPLCMRAQDGSLVIGVFDGLGGAGAGLVNTGQDTQRTEAAIAANLAASITHNFFLKELNHCSLDEIAERFEKALRLGFREKNQVISRVPSRVKSSMSKNLPTTVAIARFFENGGSQTIQVLWAGDSRVYRVNGSGRLECLTRDHCRHRTSASEIDYLASNGDAAMINCVSASEDFSIARSEIVDLDTLAIFACSDGLLSAFPDHTEFEVAILSALIGVMPKDQFVSLVASRRTDDVSAAFIEFNLEEPDKSRINERIEYLADKIIPHRVNIEYSIDIMETFGLGKKKSAEALVASDDLSVTNNSSRVLIGASDDHRGINFLSGISELDRNRLRVALWLSLIGTYGATLVILCAGLLFALLSS